MVWSQDAVLTLEAGNTGQRSLRTRLDFGIDPAVVAKNRNHFVQQILGRLACVRRCAHAANCILIAFIAKRRTQTRITAKPSAVGSRTGRVCILAAVWLQTAVRFPAAAAAEGSERYTGGVPCEISCGLLGRKAELCCCDAR